MNPQKLLDRFTLLALLFFIGWVSMLATQVSATTNPGAAKVQGAVDDSITISGNPLTTGGVTSGSVNKYHTVDKMGAQYQIATAQVDSITYTGVISSSGTTNVQIIPASGTLFSVVLGCIFRNTDTVLHTVTVQSVGSGKNIAVFDIPAQPGTASATVADNWVVLPNDQLMFSIDAAGTGTSVKVTCHYFQRQ